MPIEQYTYWSITINNPDENDYLIVRNPNPKYVRELVWTPEVGADGTEHIQAWARLQRNQTMAFVKKIYPRAHLKHTDKDLYNENSHQYAQKNDSTTAGNHHITLNDPLPANDTLLYKVLEEAFHDMIRRDDFRRNIYEDEGLKSVLNNTTLKKHLWTDVVESRMITERSGLEKIFISPVYEKMKSKYWREILLRIMQKNAGGSNSESEERIDAQTSSIQDDGSSITTEASTVFTCDSSSQGDSEQSSRS